MKITILYLPLDSKDPNPYTYNSAVSFLHVWVRKEVNINILASDVNGTILRLPVPVESLVLIGWENYCQNEERVGLTMRLSHKWLHWSKNQALQF